ncbi:TAXI family TRAP transporter solute-binding subunit [Streptomyces sp. NPDC057638]|uniref:TAXI family TRAP transporter solute-binding subunit n=1 Tax=Streptomyces sp. NPDC057638 TaxID=3346190 RepID=UPI0036AAF23C
MFPSLRRLSRRRALVVSTALLTLLGAALWWLFPFRETTPSGSLTFSTGLRNGVYQRYGEMLRDALHRDLPDVTVRLSDSHGSRMNLERIANGDADFTIATADAVAAFQDQRGTRQLRGCARLYDDYVQLVVPADSPIERVSDLRGRKVGVGQQGSGVRLIAERLLRAAEIDPASDIRPVDAGIDTLPEKLRGGGVDAFFWSGGLPTGAVETLAKSYPVRLVPLDRKLALKVISDSGGGVDDGYYRPAVIPADAYHALRLAAPVPTLAVANLLVTTDRVDDALVEGFTRTVIKSRDRIGRTVHPAQLVDLRTAIYTDPLDLHDGARRYYASVKP